MVDRHKLPQIQLYLSEELREAVREFAANNGLTVADVGRTAIANHIGRPDLAESVKMGRPSKPDDVEPSPARRAPKKVVRRRKGPE